MASANPLKQLVELLSPKRLTEIVDIGANAVDGDPPYQILLEECVAHLTGFEPQQSAYKELKQQETAQARYLPYAVGTGNTHVLHLCAGSGMTSLLEPDEEALKIFEVLEPFGKVVAKETISTKRLDDIDEIEALDFLKIDIQGGELDAFRYGREKLRSAVVIQVEVSFITLYKDQPAFGKIDIELRSQGFVPHCFAAVKRWPIAPCVIDGNPRKPLNQLLEADIVYVRNFFKQDSLTDEQLKHMAIVCYGCYGSIDLAMRCVMLLENRGALPAGSQASFLKILSGAGSFS